MICAPAGSGKDGRSCQTRAFQGTKTGEANQTNQPSAGWVHSALPVYGITYFVSQMRPQMRTVTIVSSCSSPAGSARLRSILSVSTTGPATQLRLSFLSCTEVGLARLLTRSREAKEFDGERVRVGQRAELHRPSFQNAAQYMPLSSTAMLILST